MLDLGTQVASFTDFLQPFHPVGLSSQINGTWKPGDTVLAWPALIWAHAVLIVTLGCSSRGSLDFKSLLPAV
ncbi:hypothetical protein DKX38_020448 [Salix brachista]|uniref:Uncharacterized protein n=1 Tax=Salix brachista TaxID=2182728 RepID=A0A5N5K5C6_9ROSI|nr:hypothetical protein DKX38_020448 [Salix brachista]